MRAAMMVPFLMLAACATTAGAPPALDGTRWQLASAEGGGPLALAEARAVTAEFTADRAAGFSGCNQYSGPYTLEGSTLSVGAVIATKRGCLGPGSQIERAWFDLLAQPLQVAREGEALVLRGSGVAVRLEPAPAR